MIIRFLSPPSFVSSPRTEYCAPHQQGDEEASGRHCLEESRTGGGAAWRSGAMCAEQGPSAHSVKSVHTNRCWRRNGRFLLLGWLLKYQRRFFTHRKTMSTMSNERRKGHNHEIIEVKIDHLKIEVKIDTKNEYHKYLFCFDIYLLMIIYNRMVNVKAC